MPSLIPLDNTLGAVTLGSFLSAILFGITCLQSFLYFTKHGARDPPLLKLLVLAIWILDSIHLALLIILVYHYSIANFGDFFTLLKTTWSLEIQILIGAILTSLVQSFYSWRVWQLNGKNLFLPATIAVLSLAHLGFAIAFMIGGFKVQFNSRTAENKPWSVSALSLDLATDTIIASSICYYLYFGRSEFTGTNRVLNTLILYTVNSCLLTTLCILASLAFFLTHSDTYLYAPWYFVACRFYAVSLLSMLNSRDHVRSKLHKRNQEGTIVLSKLSYGKRENGDGMGSFGGASSANQDATHVEHYPTFTDSVEGHGKFSQSV